MHFPVRRAKRKFSSDEAFQRFLRDFPLKRSTWLGNFVNELLTLESDGKRIALDNKKVEAKAFADWK